MTIPALIVLSALIGTTVAYAARVQIRTLQRPVFSTRYFSALMMFQVMILLPIGIYFYTFYPDWSWMYLVDTSSMSRGVGVMAIVSYPIAGALGYMVGYYSARGSSDWVTVMFIVFMIIGLIGLFAVAKNKIYWVGTYAQYHRAAGLSALTATSLLPSTLLSISGVGVCWSYLVYRFIQEGRLSLRAF
ncbi:MAG: hypothetical protein GY854_05515 [Deltaproteobacteria bacterium]|nr:hypothetical protein [Deltaproteobacteria bacterium]